LQKHGGFPWFEAGGEWNAVKPGTIGEACAEWVKDFWDKRKQVLLDAQSRISTEMIRLASKPGALALTDDDINELRGYANPKDAAAALAKKLQDKAAAAVQPIINETLWALLRGKPVERCGPDQMPKERMTFFQWLLNAIGRPSVAVSTDPAEVVKWLNSDPKANQEGKPSFPVTTVTVAWEVPLWGPKPRPETGPEEPTEWPVLPPPAPPVHQPGQ
jgi:hypothetical protein